MNEFVFEAEIQDFLASNLASTRLSNVHNNQQQQTNLAFQNKVKRRTFK